MMQQIDIKAINVVDLEDKNTFDDLKCCDKNKELFVSALTVSLMKIWKIIK